MGPKPEYIETVITCEGDYYSPDFQQQFACFSERLSNLLISGECNCLLDGLYLSVYFAMSSLVDFLFMLVSVIH